MIEEKANALSEESAQIMNAAMVHGNEILKMVNRFKPTIEGTEVYKKIQEALMWLNTMLATEDAKKEQPKHPMPENELNSKDSAQA